MNKKMAYVSVTYLFSFEPKDVGLDENCSRNEFDMAVEKIIDKEINFIAEQADIIPNDIETDICGDF